MPLVSVKIVSVYAGVAHESVDAVEVNKDAIVMIKKGTVSNYFPDMTSLI